MTGNEQVIFGIAIALVVLVAFTWWMLRDAGKKVKVSQPQKNEHNKEKHNANYKHQPKNKKKKK